MVLVAALATAGCSGAGDASPPTSGHAPGVGESSSGSPAPSQEPRPHRYTDRQLAAALPQGRHELHGVTRIADECRDLAKACHGIRGWGLVDANSDPESIELVVSVRRTNDPAIMREQQRRCPNGPIDHPLRWQDEAHTSYVPGERGDARRMPLTVGEWHGFVCQKTGVLVWDEGRTSDRFTWQSALLTNGVHFLSTSGRTMAMTKALAREYVDRLSVAGLVG